MNDLIQEMVESIEAVATQTCEADPAAFRAWLDDSKDPRPGYGGLVGWFENIYYGIVDSEPLCEECGEPVEDEDNPLCDECARKDAERIPKAPPTEDEKRDRAVQAAAQAGEIPTLAIAPLPLEPGLYSCFLLHENGTWEQPTYRLPITLTEEQFIAALQQHVSRKVFYITGIGSDDECPDDQATEWPTFTCAYCAAVHPEGARCGCPERQKFA